MAETISQIHQAAAGTPPPPPPPRHSQFEGFFSQIHQSPSSLTPSLPAQGTELSDESPVLLPKSEAQPPNANTGPLGGRRTDRSRVTFQDLTDKIDGSEASFDNALETLLKSGPPLDFSPPPPATPPPFFILPPDEEFTLEHAGGDGPEKDVLSPNLAEIMGINSLADLTNGAGEAVPKNVPQVPAKPQIPPLAQDVIPDLPDEKPKRQALGDDSDFLKMFPGVGG
jgi:hypothetical protein